VIVAYSYRQNSGLSVCVCAGHVREPCKTAQLIKMAFRELTRMGIRNHVLDGD